ncbi:MAG: glycosyltransferase family 2 protein [Lachnospiraceae bacterium]|nr:glycosyltransferase family 2 protein [Lachnospiraceae bacterium]
MQIVITMAGLGTRFRKAGYDLPKYEIEVRGRTLFSWSMESISSFFQPGCDCYFIVRSEDGSADFILNEWKKITGSDAGAHVIPIDHMTDGQATTAMLAAPLWKKDDSLLIYNIDTYVEAGQMRPEDVEGDGFIPCFNAPGDHWSFVATDENGDAVKVAEKQRISDNCTVGAYFFATCALYEKLYKEYYKDDSNMQKGEKYVAPMYDHMISSGYKVRIKTIDADRVHVLGTPEELKIFAEEGN